MCVTGRIMELWETTFAGCGKALCFSMCCECIFHQRNGLLCTFPRCLLSLLYQPNNGKRYVPDSNDNFPYQNKTSDNTANDKVKRPYPNGTSNIIISRYQPDEHFPDTKGNAAEYPKQQIICFPILGAEGNKKPVQYK